MSLIPFTILLLLVSLEIGHAADLNVGTTLFTKADRCKECWSSESLALLTSRMILEDLLPSTTILVIDSNDFVTDLVEYFRMILEIVRQETHGKTKHITLMALTDLLGGYLHHAVLPIAKFAYYAGLIDYDSMSTLLGLFDELKWFLRTNGQGWAKPLPQNIENFEIQRIPLQPCNDKDVCENLMLVEAETEGDGAKPAHCDVTIPVPFFDSLTQPSAIALPTKSCPLHNVESNSSSYLVMKFFVSAYKCLLSKNARNQNVEKFQNDFGSWIEDQIMPRLEDEKFYAAFGGVLRVRNTLKRLGISQSNLNKQIEEFQNVANNVDKATGEDGGQHQLSRSSMILMAVLITIFVWFFLGTLFICYRMRQTREKGSSPEEPDKTTTTSLGSSKYFYPERPKAKESKRGRGAAETDSGSEMDLTSYNKSVRHEGPRHQITIRTCHCREEDDATSVVESTNTAGRLPSITEMSEQTTESNRQRRVNQVEKVPSPGTSTAASERRNEVQQKIYEDLEESTEETSEPD